MAKSTWLAFAVFAGVAAVYYSGHAKCLLKAANLILHGKHGCLPVGDVGNITLHYFDVRGRGESIRLLMEYANIPYNEINFDGKSWPEYKEKGIKSGLYTFGQVPAIESGSGMSLVQSQVILHYLARSAGLDCDCDMYHWCETLAATTEDIRSKLGKLLYDANFSLKQRSEYLDSTVPMWFAYLEKLAPTLTSDSLPAFVGDRITWVDFLIFDLIDTNANFGFYEFGEGEGSLSVSSVNVLKKFPKLSVYYTEFNQLPALTRYFASQRRRPFTIPYKPVELRNIKQ